MEIVRKETDFLKLYICALGSQGLPLLLHTLLNPGRQVRWMPANLCRRDGVLAPWATVRDHSGGSHAIGEGG